jgi:CDP-glycerol glycerophosphotransferase (TagB/SpsB family)
MQALDSPAVRRFFRKVRKTGTYEWHNYWRSRPIQDDTILYESFSGNGMVCNPEAIFRALLRDPAFAHLKHIWVLSDLAQYHSTVEEFSDNPRVTFVRHRSAQYSRALATSKYLVNNATFPPEFSKREGQIYLNTWHGTPLKAMGYDSPEGGRGAGNVLRNFLMADYLLSSSPYMTERMYRGAFRLTNVFRGKVLTEGFPRVDRQHLGDDDRFRVRECLRASGVRLQDSDRVVLYAPTWRGASFGSPSNDVALLGERVRAMRAHLPEGHRVLLKVHQRVYAFALEHPELAEVLVPNDLPTNLVLGITDVLVNDYSSVFFDFLATGRPIIFFTPDRQGYERGRGLYVPVDELPGPVANSIPEVARLIEAVGTGRAPDPQVTHHAVYAAARHRFAPQDDGSSTRRIIDIVLRRRPSEHDVDVLSPDGRESILIYLGGLRSNGITASALSLLANIDHDRYDVSAFYDASSNPDRQGNEAKIDPRVRLLPRVGGIRPSKKDRFNRQRLQTVGMDAPRLNLDAMRALFRDEWRRCFGDARFDHVIDYSGYAPYWAFLLLQGPARTHSIWLHSDLKSDQMREVDGRRPHEANLRAVFSMYSEFDHLVSVSPALCRMNAANLSATVDVDKHTWARNSINVSRIKQLGQGWEGSDGTDEPGSALSDNLTKAVAALAARHGLPALTAEVERLRVIDRVVAKQPGSFVFVAVGRLSPEKNYPRMLEAFGLLHQGNPESRLIIVGGGPLIEDLDQRVQQLGLSGAVTLAGQQSNPYAIMAQADCFVLSSDYEGHPMVFLEARVLGLPIVSTHFPSVASALPEGTGLVVAPAVEALADGMDLALHHQVPRVPFDGQAYNSEVLEEFYRAIGAKR